MKNYISITSIFLLAAFLLFLCQSVSLSVVLPFEKLNQILFGGLFDFLPPSSLAAHGSSSDNIRGWLWSENFGWVSTNCYNNYDLDYEFENCCPGGENCPYTPSAGDYGLNYDKNDHTLSGYAWSEHLGWLCFGKSCSVNSPDGHSAWACVGTRKTNDTCLPDCGEDFNYNQTCDSASHPNLKAQWKFNNIINRYGTTPSEVNSPVLDALLGPDYPTNSALAITGRHNNALYFDGIDDYTRVEDNEALDLSTNFTIEGWVFLKNPDDLPPPYSEQIMLRKDQAYALGVIPPSFDKFEAWLYINDNWQKFGFSDFNLRTTYLNKWRHVAMTYDGRDVRLYLDGVLDGAYAVIGGGGINMAETPLYLGGEEAGAHLYGYLDNIAIYNQTKTPEEIWLDAKKEVSGWARILNSDQDKGWIKLNNSDITSENPAWGFYLDDHSEGGGFYTLGSLAYYDYWPYYYQLRSWSWSADLDNSNQVYGLGWLTGSHKFSWTMPRSFDNFQVTFDGNLSPCPQNQLSWSPSRFAQWYIFGRVQKNSSELCPSPNWTDYTPYPVLRGSCNEEICQTTDSNSLEENTGYCYIIQAWNYQGSRWATNNPPTYPHPYWLKTGLCQINNPILVQGNKCGRLEIYWNPTDQEAEQVDGYNLYRSVKSNGCESLTSNNCLLIGHLGEAISFENLRAQWKMNETSWSGNQGEVKDSSGYLNHGTAYNGPNTFDGKFKRAGSFDGLNDYLLVPEADVLDIGGTDSFTLSGWLKTTDLNGAILEKISTSAGYRLKINDGYLECYIKDTNGKDATVGGKTLLNNGSWHYFACVLNRTNNSLKVFLNGKDDTDSGKSSGNPSEVGDLSNSDNLTIAGAVSGDASVYFSGLLDNLSLTKRAKSDNEILFDSEALPLSTSCALNEDQIFKYGQSSQSLNCTTNGPCCQFVDKRITAKTIYYYWITQITENGQSPAKEPLSGCQTPGETNYRYGCDKTLCAEKIEQKEKQFYQLSIINFQFSFNFSMNQFVKRFDLEERTA